MKFNTICECAVNRRRLLLQIACALSSDDHLSQHLAPASHQEGSQPDKPVGSMGLGFCLLSEVVAAVSCLESTEGFHDSILTVIDNLLCHGKTVQDEVLLPHVPQLIDALKQYILAVFAGDVPADFSGTVVRSFSVIKLSCMPCELCISVWTLLSYYLFLCSYRFEPCQNLGCKNVLHFALWENKKALTQQFFSHITANGGSTVKLHLIICMKNGF